VNSFTRRAVSQFPSDPIPLVVFALLTDGVGEIQLEITIDRLDTLDEVYRLGTSYDFSDQLHEVRLVFRLRDCSFPVAGHHQVTLLADGEPIAQRKLHLYQKGDQS
jgi:hypothetical protein